MKPPTLKLRDILTHEEVWRCTVMWHSVPAKDFQRLCMFYILEPVKSRIASTMRKHSLKRADLGYIAATIDLMISRQEEV